MNSNEKRITSFRLTQTTIDKLHSLKNRINSNTPIKLSNADIIEILVRRADANNITKKVNEL